MKRIKTLLCVMLAVLLSLSSTAFAYAETSKTDEFEYLKKAILKIDSISDSEIEQFVHENREWIDEVGMRLEAYLNSVPVNDQRQTLTYIMGGTPSPRGNNLSDYFKSTRYHYRGGYWTYSVNPKWSVRLYRPTMEAAWSALGNAYYGIRNDNGSLWNQYLCHWDYDAFGIVAGEWDLEVGRPVIPYSQMFAALCNP